MQKLYRIIQVSFPIGILLLAVIIFYWPGVRPGYTFVPVDLANNNAPWLEDQPKALQNWLISDPLYQFYPFQNRTTESLRSGSLLLWDHTIFLGHPAFADPLYQTFYPLLVPFTYFFGAARGLALGLVAHVVLAVLLMYMFLQACTFNRAAATTGALIYALGGFMVTWFETPFWTTTLSLFPGVVLFYQLSIVRKSVLYATFAGVGLGLSILAGQFQFVLTFSCLIAAYALGFMLYALAQNQRQAWWPLAALLVMFCVGLLLSGIQIAPFFEFLQTTRRTVAQGLFDPLAPEQLITLLGDENDSRKILASSSVVPGRW